MGEKKEIERECKFVIHIPKEFDRPDMHYVKEKIFYPDGTTGKNLRMIKNFKRPFYLTKEHFRNHQQKKESEQLERLNKHLATESDMIEEAGRLLGPMYIGSKNQRFVKDSPYLYGCDVTSRTFIKKAYFDKWGKTSEYEVCVLDLERETNGEERVTVISIAMIGKLYTAILEPWLKGTEENLKKIQECYNKYVPKTDITENINDTTEFFKTEVEMIQAVFKKLHEWQPDFVEIFNITYDIGVILEVLDKAGVPPKEVFSDPNVPKELRYFKFKMGKIAKKTEKGVHKGLMTHEQWHTVIAPASFYFVDGSSVYNYIRQGGKQVPTGYSLDSLLTHELGDKFKKLKIPDGVAETLDGVLWHEYMSTHRKHEYVVYNKYDILGPLILDQKTKDIRSTMPLLAEFSPFTMFDTNPPMLAESLYFFYLENGWVLGTAPTTKDDDKKLGMGDWIIMLPSARIKNKGSRFLQEGKAIETTFRSNVFDSDQKSGYPSNGQAANVSKDTTMRELLDVKGISKSKFKKQNINLFFGPVNQLEYAQQMFNFPSLFEVEDYVSNKLKKENINSDNI